MATVLVMPKLGLTMTEGMVSRWLVNEGDAVRRGQPIVEVMTEKITNEVEAPADGVLLKIVVAEGETVPVTTPIAYIGEAGEAIPTGDDLAPAETSVAAPVGAVATPAEGKIVPLTPLRRVIGQRLTQSFRDVPHFVVTLEVDMSACTRFREQANERLAAQNVRVSFNDVLVKLVAQALLQHPAVNASFEDTQLRYHSAANVGVAVAIPDGLIVPVVHRAEQKSLLEIARATGQLTEKARAGRLDEQDVTGGTFTISNMGMYEVDLFTAIINPPQSAILAVGRIAERPYVVGGQLEVRPTCFFSLSCDHRVLDGAVAAAFLSLLKALLEDPAQHIDTACPDRREG